MGAWDSKAAGRLLRKQNPNWGHAGDPWEKASGGPSFVWVTNHTQVFLHPSRPSSSLEAGSWAPGIISGPGDPTGVCQIQDPGPRSYAIPTLFAHLNELESRLRSKLSGLGEAFLGNSC